MQYHVLDLAGSLHFPKHSHNCTLMSYVTIMFNDIHSCTISQSSSRITKSHEVTMCVCVSVCGFVRGGCVGVCVMNDMFIFGRHTKLDIDDIIQMQLAYDSGPIQGLLPHDMGR